MKITLPENLELPAAGDGELLGAWVRRRDEPSFLCALHNVSLV